MDIQKISEVLAAALQDESTFAEAESLYAECFKDAQTFTVASGYYSREELVNHLMSDICEPYKRGMPDYWEPAVIKEGWTKEKAESLVDNLEFVFLCNYKGEEEGIDLACRTKGLRTFISKHNYK